jgi:hypothetical protein
MIDLKGRAADEARLAFDPAIYCSPWKSRCGGNRSDTPTSVCGAKIPATSVTQILGSYKLGKGHPFAERVEGGDTRGVVSRWGTLRAVRCECVFIDSKGWVDIGTNTPRATLDVAGTLNVSNKTNLSNTEIRGPLKAGTLDVQVTPTQYSLLWQPARPNAQFVGYTHIMESAFKTRRNFFARTRTLLGTKNGTHSNTELAPGISGTALMVVTDTSGPSPDIAQKRWALFQTHGRRLSPSSGSPSDEDQNARRSSY